MSIQLRHLRYAEVAERYERFRKAANSLGRKRSSLSRRFRHLQEQIGEPLI